MQPEQMKQCIDKVEQLADQARNAVKAAGVPEDLKRSVDDLHAKASDAKHNPTMGDSEFRDRIMQLEQGADQAMQACRNAGQGVDAQTRDAIQRLHGELSRQKHDLEQHA